MRVWIWIYLKNHLLTNTNIIWFENIIRIRISLFGLNYLNTELFAHLLFQSCQSYQSFKSCQSKPSCSPSSPISLAVLSVYQSYLAILLCSYRIYWLADYLAAMHCNGHILRFLRFDTCCCCLVALLLLLLLWCCCCCLLWCSGACEWPGNPCWPFPPAARATHTALCVPHTHSAQATFEKVQTVPQWRKATHTFYKYSMLCSAQ